MKHNQTEITLVDLIKLFLKRKKLFLSVLAIVITVGVIKLVFSPVEWKSISSLLPESDKNKSEIPGGLAGIAGLSGINLSNSVDGIDPSLYPRIVSSTPFLKALSSLNVKMLNAEDSISVADYMTFYTKGSILNTTYRGIKNLIFGQEKNAKPTELDPSGFNFDNKEIQRPNNSERSLYQSIKDRVNIEMEQKSGIINVGVLMQDPEVSALMTKFTIQYIVEYVQNYNSNKARRSLEFIEQQLESKRKGFLEAQNKLSSFKDSHKNINSNQARDELVNLEAEYNLAFNILSTLSQKREEALIKLQEDKMVFLPIEPVSVPNSKESPKRLQILTNHILFGVFLGIISVFLSLYFQNLRKQIASTK